MATITRPTVTDIAAFNNQGEHDDARRLRAGDAASLIFEDEACSEWVHIITPFGNGSLGGNGDIARNGEYIGVRDDTGALVRFEPRHVRDVVPREELDEELAKAITTER